MAFTNEGVEQSLPELVISYELSNRDSANQMNSPYSIGFGEHSAEDTVHDSMALSGMADSRNRSLSDSILPKAQQLSQLSGSLGSNDAAWPASSTESHSANIDYIDPAFERYFAPLSRPASSPALAMSVSLNHHFQPPIATTLGRDAGQFQQQVLPDNASSLPSEPRYKCRQNGCIKYYKNKGDMERHFVTHGPPLFICPVQSCKYHDRGFHRKDHHIKHLRTHGLPEAWIESARAMSPKDELAAMNFTRWQWVKRTATV